MATSKIKKGDKVVVIAGKNKGKDGKVIEVKNGKVLIEGINVVTKHAKPSQESPQGGIVQKEAPIDISNVMYLAGKDKPSRIGFKIENGKKVRYAKATEETIN